MEPKTKIRADDVDKESYLQQHPELDPQQRDVLRGPIITQDQYGHQWKPEDEKAYREHGGEWWKHV